MTRGRRAAARRWATTAVLVVAACLLPGQAWAHGGDIDLQIGGDGLNGVTLVATWAEDGHPVGPEVDFTMTATAADGVTAVGPVEVPLAGEGQSFRTLPDVLSAGVWQVEVQASGSSDETFDGTVEVIRTASEQPAIEAAAASSVAVLAEQGGDQSVPAAASGAAADPATGGVGGPVAVAVAVAALLAAAAAGVLVLRRRAPGTHA